jgi:hypothetical protein
MPKFSAYIYTVLTKAYTAQDSNPWYLQENLVPYNGSHSEDTVSFEFNILASLK